MKLTLRKPDPLTIREFLDADESGAAMQRAVKMVLGNGGR
jgi:hypothetical protein